MTRYKPAHALVTALCAAMGLAQAAPAAGPGLMQSGRSLMAEGEYGGAARDFAEAVRLAPANATALNNLAVAKAAAGDYQSALELLARARKAAPARPEIGHNLALLRDWAKSYGSAGPRAPATSEAVNPEPPALWGAPGCKEPACK